MVAYCSLPIWHEPCKPGVLPEGETIGYVSADGHFFKCTLGTGGGCYFSTYFIIDRSVIMLSNDVQPQSPEICTNVAFDCNLANRLGAVCEAMVTYITTRKAVSPADTITFVSFSETTLLSFSQLSVTNDQRAVSEMMQVKPAGRRASVDAGLLAVFNQLNADEVCGSNQGRTPVFILLTGSGECGHALQILHRNMREVGRAGLKVHCLGFGVDQVDTAVVRQLAAQGNGAFYSNLGRCDLDRCLSLSVTWTRSN